MKSNVNVLQRTPADNVGSIIHGMLARSTDGVVPIAPGIAKRILQEAHFDGQRKVQASRVAERIHDIRAGNWNPRVTPITFAETPDGGFFNVNGRHRCHGIVEANTRVENLVVVVPVPDMPSVRRLYALFDTPESRRSDMDMLDGIAAAEVLGLSRKTVTAAFRALTVLRNDLEPVAGGDIYNVAKSRNERREDLPEWAEEARRFEKLFENADAWIKSKCFGATAMAFGLYVLRHSRKDADAFLRGIADNDGLRKNDPRARLLADFQSRNVTSGNARQGVQRWAVAWNAFIEGRDLNLIKCIEGAPIVIKGTPKGKGVR